MRLRRMILALIGAMTLVVPMVPKAADAASPVTLVAGKESNTNKVSPTKINVMGLWAHPDDDAGMVTPCGVWKDRYDIKCGIIMLTRGEGGSNSVGDEQGPDLGLRRENEDRTSFYRSGTLDIYNVDAVDFFYNTSSPLTQQVWGKERIQRQVVRILRQTQPDVITGFQPTPAGHGNHQYAARLIWETIAMAADPTAFPEQLTGPHALKTWQVKQVLGSYWSSPGTGGVEGPGCNKGFAPNANTPFTVTGTWTGYDSPYKWLDGNVQGQPAGTPMTWAQVGREGYMTHATQARSKFVDVKKPECIHYGVLHSNVPFQPQGSDGNGRDDSPLLGAILPDPGGMPLGSTFVVDTNRFQTAAKSFDVTVTARSAKGTIAEGDLTVDLPAGWTASTAKLGPITADGEQKSTITVTPAPDATPTVYKLGVYFSNGTVKAYNDTRVEIVPGVEGRFQRWGNFAEYETWADTYTYVSGRSKAERSIGAGETITVPVVLTNRTAANRSGEVRLELPVGLSADQSSISYSELAPGGTSTVTFHVTHTDPAALGGTKLDVKIVTTSDIGQGTETLTLFEVPTTVIPHAATAPTVDGKIDAAGYGPELNIGRLWEGKKCDPDGKDCGEGSIARAAWHGDDLYVVAKVIDDRASGAAAINRCFGHWLVDSVEVMLDPLGGSTDTSTTFKTGIMPRTDDPTNKGGYGVNGACWSRDADNHQGFSSGPLAKNVLQGANSPGQEVKVTMEVSDDGSIKNGHYIVEAKIPLKNLPAGFGPTSKAPTGDLMTNAVDPTYLGMNVTPYDSDVNTFIGKSRLAWSPFNGQQSEPYRWGHAYLEDYQPPADRSKTPAKAVIPDTALQSVASPQTIYQSATRGVTIAGHEPSDDLVIEKVQFTAREAAIQYRTAKPGTVRAYIWKGNPEWIQVWNTSCKNDPLGFSSCKDTDNTAAKWDLDMSGRVISSVTQSVSDKGEVKLTLSQDDRAKLADGGLLLVAYESSDGKVNAWSYELTRAEQGEESPTPTPSPSPSDEPSPTPTQDATPQPSDSSSPNPSDQPTTRQRKLPDTGY